ncbi:unnamed protein product, partial [Mesorhabditis belari]|uniref:non-specific serine/threonine protein kinase n=1 Tax=Mesorhabditis belari TaxID=2138241 RepID=A0AAF3F8W6_9BILA
MDEKNVVQIGEGGFGRVLLLEDYNPPYVMKEVARGKDIDAQQKELLILKELTHKYIVKYLDQPSDFLYKGEHYPIFMEFCEHGSLRHG